MICLGDKKDETDSGILRLLEVLLSSERATEEKKQILENEYDIEMTTTLEGEVSEMCNLSDGVEKRGIQKGRIESLKNLMKNMKWTMEQAMDAIGIPKDEREMYRDAIQK